MKENNPVWSQIPDYLSRILKIGGSESGAINALFNIIGYQPDVDTICL